MTQARPLLSSAQTRDSACYVVIITVAVVPANLVDDTQKAGLVRLFGLGRIWWRIKAAARALAGWGSTRRGSWVLASSGVVAMLVATWIGAHFVADSIGQSRDLLGRISNLRDLSRTGDIYVPFAGQAFTYPPGAIFLFWPLQFIPAGALATTWALLSLAALAGAIATAYHFLWRAASLITIAMACWTTAIGVAILGPVQECLGWGQTSTILLCLVAVDYLVLRGWSHGILVGVATAFKLYPGVFILVWLWRREWRTALSAAATAVLVTGLASLLWPRSVHTYVTSILFGGRELVKFSTRDLGTGSSSLLTVLTGWPFPHHELGKDVALITLGVLVVVGVVAIHLAWRRGCVLSSLVLGLIVSSIAAPVAWDHYFTFAPLLVMMGFELGWKSVLARTGIVSFVVLLVPWHTFRTRDPGHWWSGVVYFAAREAIILAMLAVLVSVFWDAWHTREPSHT